MGINVNISALNVSSLTAAQEEMTSLVTQAKAAIDAAGAAASEPIGSAIKGKFETFSDTEIEAVNKALSEIIADLSNLSQNYSKGVDDLLAEINSISISAGGGN